MDKTLVQLQTEYSANTKKLEEMLKVEAMTDEQMTEFDTLEAATETLGEEIKKVKKVDDAKKRNEARTKALKTPVNAVEHEGGDGGETDPANATKSTVEFRGVAELKHITGGTRQENELKAYRFSQFLLGGLFKNQKSIEWCATNGVALKAVNESVNEQGAVLVPEEFDRMIIRMIEQYGVWRANTRVVPMASDTRSQPRRTGGVTAYWVGEGKQITASTPAWDNVLLVARKLAALVVHSSEIAEDAAINLADDLAFEIGYAFAQAEDNAGFNGDGTSTYGGITGVRNALLNLSATRANIAGLWVGADNAWSGLLLSDFENVIALSPAYADTPQAAWYVHKTFYNAVMKRLELAAGGVTAAEVAQGGSRTPIFLGYPVKYAQIMPRVEANDQVCAIFGDLSLASTMGDRRRITLFSDPYSLSNYDQVQIRGTERVDINVHDVGNASGTASARVAGPVTGLLTAAS